MRIAVVGARGQLGGAVVHRARQDHEVIAFDRALLDIEDDDAVQRAMREHAPHVIINCAGYNAVDAAETNPVDALRANAFAVRSLARAASEFGATLVQYSSDFVFDGTATEPMTEAVAPNPRSTYASSKLLGEWFASDAPTWYVLRVESLFGVAPGLAAKGSLETIIKGLRAGQVVRVFGDRTVSPTYVHDAAEATLALVGRRAESGIYHCVNSGAGTWRDVAIEAARLLGVEPRFDVINAADLRLPTERPKYCALSNARLSAAIGYEIPTWQDALGRHLSQPLVNDPR